VCDVSDCAGGSGIAYVGSATCKGCHVEIGEKVDKSGHPYKLNRVVGGVRPELPFDSQTGGIPSPPLGLTWDDITYVIGGFGWKARYIGTDGYIVTGGSGDGVQWNFPNSVLGAPGGWVEYHPGEMKPYDCGSCHTTGWIPCPVGDATCEHQDGLAGMAGSFEEPGVQCEACHGPGNLHAANPYLVDIKIDRDAEACGSCHRRGAVETIDAGGGFIKHHEQWEEQFQSKKHSMRCIDCHDPHASSKFADAVVNPNKGIRVACLSCHIGYDTNQTTAYRQERDRGHGPALGRYPIAPVCDQPRHCGSTVQPRRLGGHAVRDPRVRVQVLPSRGQRSGAGEDRWRAGG
jgi:hypothetical protein